MTTTTIAAETASAIAITSPTPTPVKPKPESKSGIEPESAAYKAGKVEYMGAWDYTKMPGTTLPFVRIFDPCDFAPYASEAQYTFYQEAELKHGRTAMLAVLGIFIGEKFPLFYDHAITGPAITHFVQVQNIFPAFWVHLL